MGSVARSISNGPMRGAPTPFPYVAVSALPGIRYRSVEALRPPSSARPYEAEINQVMK